MDFTNDDLDEWEAFLAKSWKEFYDKWYQDYNSERRINLLFDYMKQSFNMGRQGFKKGKRITKEDYSIRRVD